jgi:hypothetical protein
LTKLNAREKLGFLYITLAHFGLGMVIATDILLNNLQHPIIFLLSAILLVFLCILDYAILHEGLDVAFKKKEAK